MTSQSDPITQYLAHSFETDEQYKQGLEAILSNVAFDQLSEDERQTALRRSRVFYFNKLNGFTISEDEAKLAEETHTHDKVSEETDKPTEETPRILTFSELQELITQGKTDQIPNNKVIPDAIHEAPPSQSTAAVRKKPWEA